MENTKQPEHTTGSGSCASPCSAFSEELALREVELAEAIEALCLGSVTTVVIEDAVNSLRSNWSDHNKEDVTTITLEEAFKVLEECSALSMEDGALFYPSLSDLEGSDENEFAYFQWESEEGTLGFNATFAEGENQSVTVVNNLMTLVDVEGEEVTFYVLCPMMIKGFLSSLPNVQDHRPLPEAEKVKY